MYVRRNFATNAKTFAIDKSLRTVYKQPATTMNFGLKTHVLAWSMTKHKAKPLGQQHRTVLVVTLLHTFVVIAELLILIQQTRILIR